MTKNKIRGKPVRKTNRVRDSDITKKIKKDIDCLIKKGIKYADKNRKKLIPYPPDRDSACYNMFMTKEEVYEIQLHSLHK